jgi:hypothetical protein
VNLTKADFIELQLRLEGKNPSRSSPSYVAADVSAVKMDFLRSRTMHNKAGARLAIFEAGPKLVPLVTHKPMDTAALVSTSPTQTDPQSTEAAPGLISTDTDSNGNLVPMDADLETLNADANPSYISADAASLSEGENPLFPGIIQYMDLAVLELKNPPPRVPTVMLVRDEWKTMIDILNNRKEGIHGSALITGAPGIGELSPSKSHFLFDIIDHFSEGKTTFLYFILVLCLIRGQTIIFQDHAGAIYLIKDRIVRQSGKGEVKVTGPDVLALVDDTDEGSCTPNSFLFYSNNIRILLTSPLSTRHDRKWLTQHVQDRAAFVMAPWLEKESIIMSYVHFVLFGLFAYCLYRLFIASPDITLKRFRMATDICGFIPREFLRAAVCPWEIENAQGEISLAIRSSKDIGIAIDAMAGDSKPHRAFMLVPNSDRTLLRSLITPVSEWAMETIITTLDERSADAVYNLYETIKGSSPAAAFRAKLWERRGHMFFRSLPAP